VSRILHRVGFAVLGCALLASLVLFAARVSTRGRFSAPYSTYGAGPEGSYALYRLVQESKLVPQRLGHEIARLERGTLIAIAGCNGGQVRELLRPEREELTRWVEAGGLLIVAGAEHYLPESSGLSFAQRANCSDPEKDSWLEGVLKGPAAGKSALPQDILAIPSGPPLAHVLPFDTKRASTLTMGLDSHATELLSSEHGPLGFTAPMGRGRLVLLGVPESLTNRALAGGGGVVISRLVEAFAPRGPVWFDEYHLGMGERRSLMRYLRERGYGLVALQLALVVLALLFAKTARLGKARVLPSAAPRKGQSYLQALSSMYERSGDQSGALQVLARHALARLGRRYRAVGVEPEQVADWLERAGFVLVASCARKIEGHAERPLERGESVVNRARKIEEDLTFAVALGDAS
jgi:hypothetical protein